MARLLPGGLTLEGEGGFRLYQQCAIDQIAFNRRAQGVGLTMPRSRLRRHQR